MGRGKVGVLGAVHQRRKAIQPINSAAGLWAEKHAFAGDGFVLRCGREAEPPLSPGAAPRPRVQPLPKSMSRSAVRAPTCQEPARRGGGRPGTRAAEFCTH